MNKIYFPLPDKTLEAYLLYCQTNKTTPKEMLYSQCNQFVEVAGQLYTKNQLATKQTYAYVISCGLYDYRPFEWKKAPLPTGYSYLEVEVTVSEWDCFVAFQFIQERMNKKQPHTLTLEQQVERHIQQRVDEFLRWYKEPKEVPPVTFTKEETKSLSSAEGWLDA